MTSRVLDTFLELVRIDSPSRSEGLMAKDLTARLEALGFEVTVDDTGEKTGSETGNIIAILPGTVDESIVLSAHMDCVPPCTGVEPIVEDGVVRSAGETVLGGDDKSGVAAILEAVTRLIESGEPRPRILITFTVCEEIGLLGARALDPALFDGELALVADSSARPGGITIGAPFHHTVRATFKGRSAHAGTEPEKGKSAIAMAAHAISLMELGRLDEMSTANVGTITGGAADNAVPVSCRITAECRSLERDRAQEIRDAMDAALRAGAAAFDGEVEIEWELEYEGYLRDESDAEVQLVMRAAEEVGLEPYTEVTGGGSDANMLASKGCRPLVVGTGMTDYHTVDESIEVKHLEQTADLIHAVMKRVAHKE